MSGRVPAYALYVDPPLGRAGMTEREARATGRPLLIGSRPMSRVSRAVEKGETNAGVPYDVLERAVPIHPTVSELIPTMLGEMRPAEQWTIRR